MTRYTAVLLMTGGMACYALNDALVKAVAAELPTGQLLALRGAIACLVLGTLARATRPPGQRIDRPADPTPWLSPMLAWRCILEVSTAGFSVLALAHAPLATVAAIMMSAPLLVVLCAFLLRWEPWHGHRLVAAVGGLLGVVLVLQPGAVGSGNGWGVVAACLCALSLAGRDLATRQLPADLPSAGVAALATAAVCIGGIMLGTFETWQSPRVAVMGLVAAAALCAALGNLALVSACRGASLSLVAPFRYSFIVWASALGFLGWREVPGHWQITGMLLIVAGGALGMRGTGGTRG